LSFGGHFYNFLLIFKNDSFELELCSAVDKIVRLGPAIISRSAVKSSLMVNTIPDNQVFFTSGHTITDSESQFALECLHEESQHSSTFWNIRDIASASISRVRFTSGLVNTILEIIPNLPCGRPLRVSTTRGVS
jgi:hypothetical protein